MAELSINPQDDQYQDHLVVHHSDGRTEKVPIPKEDGSVVKIGRELDNDVVLVDPRSSRHHAEVRRAGSVLEIRDLDSANGTIVNKEKLEPNAWSRLLPGQQVQLAETKFAWEKPVAQQSTVAMVRPKDNTAMSKIPPPSPAPAPAPAKPAPVQQQRSMVPWLIAGGALVLLLLLIGVIFFTLFRGTDDVADQPDVVITPEAPTTEPAATSAGRGDGDLESQSLSGQPTNTPTPSGPQLAIPVLEVEDILVSPIIFGASPSTNQAYIFIDVRAKNSGNIPFQFSISNFTLQTRDGNQTFAEAGSNTSESYLKQLGAVDRFQNLALTPGGSVPGSLVFELEINTYDLELVFDVPDLDPIVLGLGTINMDRDLKLAAGTPLAALDEEAGEQPTPTPTLEPTPTPTRPALIPAPQVVSRSALAGTIAYPAFNGTDYDIYFGDVESGESRFFRAHASQPAFSPDGSRIAFHSWDNALRGIVTSDVSGANPIIIGAFIEDQLPTWTADGSEVVLLSRRSGDRKSQLFKVGSSEERTEGTVIGEGEYPSIGANNELTFKGWGNTAFGLRLSNPDFEDIQTVTNVDEDTAPAISPDGQTIAFMSRREENWDIYTINIDGSNLQRLTTDASQDGLPTWSPDGNALAFVSDRGGVWSIWVMTPDGKGKSQILTMQGPADGFVGSDTYASRGWAEERISWIK